MIFIETERLILRDWEESYKEVFFEINSDYENMRFFPSVLTREESDAMADRISGKIEKDGFGLFAVVLKETDEFIGFIGLSVPSFKADFTPRVEIGWRLHKRFWKKGLATEGAKAVLDFAFSELKLDELVSFTAEINLPSIAIMERIGMVRDADGDFDHPNVDKSSELCRHVLYRSREK